jgi:WD40 repeat protein
LNEIFLFYDKILQKKKLKVIFLKEKNLMILNFKNIINLDEEVEANIELKEIKLNKEEIFNLLVNEVILLKKKEKNKNNDSINENFINNLKAEINSKEQKIVELEKKIEEMNKNYESKIKKLEEKIEILLEDYEKRKKTEIEKEEEKKEIEKFSIINDNVNLINNFKFENIDKLKNIDVISNDVKIYYMKSVAVYSMIKSNEIIYEIAFPGNKNGYNVIFFDLNQNKISNQIKNAHSSNIYRIKHYYSQYLKSHLLLTSSNDKSIKIWNITENPISNLLTIKDCFDGSSLSPFCLMFKEERFFILGGSRDAKKKIWNQNGEIIGDIQKSNLSYGRFIEATYIENKTYILLSGEYHSECLDYDDNILKTYKNINKQCAHLIVNLFKKEENIFLITGDVSNCCIFDFKTTNLIKEIELGKNIQALCSFSNKFLIAANNNLIKIINMENFTIAKTYSGHNNYIWGIEKIQIPEKGEFIISYDQNSIKIWK